MLDALAVVSAMLVVVLAGLVALGPDGMTGDDPRRLPSRVGPALVLAAVVAVVAVVRVTDGGTPGWLVLALPAPMIVLALVLERPEAAWWARTAHRRAASVVAFGLPFLFGAAAAA